MEFLLLLIVIVCALPFILGIIAGAAYVLMILAPYLIVSTLVLIGLYTAFGPTAAGFGVIFLILGLAGYAALGHRRGLF